MVLPRIRAVLSPRERCWDIFTAVTRPRFGQAVIPGRQARHGEVSRVARAPSPRSLIVMPTSARAFAVLALATGTLLTGTPASGLAAQQAAQQAAPQAALQAARQGEPQFSRVGGVLYRVEQGELFAVDTTVISARLAAGVQGWADLVARAPASDRAALAALSVVRTSPLGVLDLRLPAGFDPLAAAARVQATGLVEFVETNAIGRYTGIPDDPQFGTQWNLHNIGQSGGTVDADVDAVEAWDILGGAPTVAVAVLDSGSMVTHTDLAANVWHNPGEIPGNATDDDGNGFVDDTVGWNFDGNNSNPAGVFYHGTSVAGVIGAVGNNGIGIAGLAGGGPAGAGGACRIMPLNIGSFSPNPAVLDDAIIYAADNGARVITMSLTVPSATAITDAIAYAVDVKGVFVDCASGNNTGSVTYPANLPTVMAVASTNRFDAKSSFSNPGPEVEVAAPGEQILMLDLNNGYTTQDGTSFAAPHVAALAGLLFSANPALTNAEVRQLIKDTADDVSTPGFDNGTGFGRINAANALAVAVGGVIGKTILYGTGLAGAGGQVPIIASQGGVPKVGNASFSVTLRRAAGSSAAAFVLGFAQASLPFKGGLLLVDLSAPSYILPVTTSAMGNASVPFAIPADPALAGLELDGQWLVIDAAAVAGISMSPGLQILIGS
jgi:subtilisin family serine protease